MPHRPFFNTGIDELEQMFEQRADDPSFRKLLGEELQHRTTPKAARLKKRLAAIEEGAQQSPKPPPVSKPAPAQTRRPKRMSLLLF